MYVPDVVAITLRSASLKWAAEVELERKEAFIVP
jgi:hypothetical protein